MSIFAALIAVIGGGLVYVLQKRIDRREEQVKDKKKAYRDYLTALNDLDRYKSYAAINPNDASKLIEAHTAESHAMDSMELYASDAVIDAARQARASLVDFIKTVSSDAQFGDMKKYSAYLSARAAFIGAMRLEIFGTHNIPSIPEMRLPFVSVNRDAGIKDKAQ